MLANPMDWPKDKQKHLVAGAGIYGVSLLLFPPAGALAVAAAVGIAKEAYDATGRGHVEFYDFLATVAGGVVGLALHQLVTFLLA